MPGAGCARSRVCSVESTRVSHHGHTGSSGISRSDGFTVSFVVSPETGFIASVAGVMHQHRRQLDTSIGMSGRHDFAVRAGAFRQEHHRVHRLPRPRS